MNSIQEARKRLITNIVTNIAEVIFASLVSLWLTPYYIQHLGVAAYAMIPLTSIIVRYFNLFLTILTGSIGRFVALYLSRNDIEQSNIYFNSAFWGILIFSFAIALPAIIFSFYFSALFHVPAGQEVDSSILFLCVVSSSLITALTSPFTVSTFVTHRFALSNFAKIFSRILQLLVIITLFTSLGAMLRYVGLGYLAMSLFILIFYISVSRHLTPLLRLNISKFRWGAFHEISSMGAWTLIDEIGTMLYLNTDLIVINLLMGAEQEGRYAALLQLVLMLRLLAPAISSVFAPVAIDLIAKEKYDILVPQTRRAIKYLGLFYALLSGGICGFATPLLQIWLGDSFKNFGPILVLLSFPQILFLSINPLYNINRGLNKVKVPALATLFGGIANILLAIAFITYTSLGLYGVSLATIISYGARSIFFTPIYTGAILKRGVFEFLNPVFPGIFWGVIVATGSWLISSSIVLNSLYGLVLWGMIVTLFFVPLCYVLGLNGEDRRFISSLFHRYGAK